MIKQEECTEKVISQLMMEIAQLRQENQIIKAERDEWKSNFELLHNSIENEYRDLGYDKTLFERNSSEQDDEYTEDELAKAYAEAEKDYKF